MVHAERPRAEHGVGRYRGDGGKVSCRVCDRICPVLAPCGEHADESMCPIGWLRFGGTDGLCMPAESCVVVASWTRVSVGQRSGGWGKARLLSPGESCPVLVYSHASAEVRYGFSTCLSWLRERSWASANRCMFGLFVQSSPSSPTCASSWCIVSMHGLVSTCVRLIAGRRVVDRRRVCVRCGIAVSAVPVSVGSHESVRSSLLVELFVCT